jgi:hypothetical protein
MFLEPIRICRPDLRAEVLELIDLVCHRATLPGLRHGEPPGTQLVPVIELVRILGINIADDFHMQLQERGSLHLGEDRFHNAGPEVDRRVRLLGFDVNINIASNLRGRLTRFHDSFQLGFQPDQSLSVSKFLFRVELRHLDLNPERIFIDFSGAKDVFIDLIDHQNPYAVR